MAARDDEELVLATGGGCMRPFIWPNGFLHVRRCRLEELRPGDIAVWFDGRTLFSHRIIRIDGDQFVTRGDWSKATDRAAASHQLLGKAIRYSRGRISYPLDGRMIRMLGRVGARKLPRKALRAIAEVVSKLKAYRKSG